MQVAIIKYNAGNIRSVDFGLQRIGVNAIITDNPEVIKAADKVIFPGVGEASTTMNYLRDKKFDLLIKDLKQPVLGICLGLQLMCSYSEENDTTCIGIFDEKVRKFEPLPGQAEKFKVPHMGWNNLEITKSGLFDKSFNNEYVYFVHSYYAGVGEHTAAKSDYFQSFSAALQKDNFYATQFHPEKSSKIGARLLKKFIAL
jgi:glutamine amidotransferase